MLGYGRAYDLSAIVRQDDHDVEQLKRSGRHNEHIDRSDALGLIAQEGPPVLRNLLLRQQLVVLRRKSPKRVRLWNIDRLLLVWLYRLYPSLLDAIIIVQPETVICTAKASSRRCAIYTRKSSEEGLEQDFNSLQAQREACEAFIKSQAGEGWRLVKTAYDDGGLSGGTMERPALQRVLCDIKQGSLIDVVVVYKVDRLTRSLADFAKMVEVFDAHRVSFVAVTQQLIPRLRWDV
jgi:Resolvase, N terminal domain